MTAVDEIRRTAIRNLTNKRVKNPTWAVLHAALKDASSADKNQLADGVNNGTGTNLQRRLRRILREHVKPQVVIDVDAALADDTLSMLEASDLLL